METKSNHNPRFRNPNPLNNTTSHNHKRAMEKFKEALVKFAHSNPSLSRNDDDNSYQRLIEQRFSQFFPDFRTPNHPPYAAMIHKAIWELNKKGGSSEESISKYIKQEYVDLPWAHSTLLKYHLEKLCDRKEICMTRKQCYLLAATDSDPISTSKSEEQVKRKQNSESGKKSSRQPKKQKSRQDSEAGKTSSRQHKKYKKKEERQLDLQETNKQIIEVFQEQDQVFQLLNEVADEQENIMLNGLDEPRYLNIVIPEGGVLANAAEQNQSEFGKDSVGEKGYMNTHFDDNGNKNQSVELANGKEQIEIHGTKKAQLKRKQRSKSQRIKSKHGKKNAKNEETQLQALSEASLKQHIEVTDGDSHEQNQMIEVKMTDIEIKDQNVAGKSVDAGAQDQLERRTNGVVEEVDKDGEITQESHPDNISFGQIQMKQNPQLLPLEESPDSNPILVKSKHPGKRGWTRSQIKTVSKKDASVSSELMESSGCAYVPKENQQVTEIVTGKDTKQVSSAVSTQTNVQRAKLRSSQKNMGHVETVMASLVAPSLQMEPQQKSISPSLEKPLKVLLNPICTKLSPQFPDLDEPATAPSSTEVLEPGSSQQDQQPDELEDQPKYQGRGKHPKGKGHSRHPKPGEPEKDEVLHDSIPAAIPKKGQQSAEKCEARSRHPKRKRVEDEVLCNLKSTDILQQVHAKDQQKYQGRCRRHKPEKVEKDEVLCVATSADTRKQGQQSNEENQPKYKCHGRHKMMRRSSRKKKKKGPSS